MIARMAAIIRGLTPWHGRDVRSAAHDRRAAAVVVAAERVEVEGREVIRRAYALVEARMRERAG